ncbi:hypothetical protein BDQ17DRAFT_1077190 [Cyathus striatus]|nr:hypothetical protein BDQ17DRAFT_1077190 [Cyathus striatus]
MSWPELQNTCFNNQVLWCYTYADLPHAVMSATHAPNEESVLFAEYESFWRNHQTWLKTAGYILRPQYCPEWVPSWLTGSKRWVAEDTAYPAQCRVC